jgi:outer membrane lipoprotein-sorting protein
MSSKQGALVMKRVIFGVLLVVFPMFANEASRIIQKLDHNMRGKNVYMKIKMSVKTKNHQRTMLMDTWSKGKKRSFVKVLAPSKERGITFLSLNGQMWQYVPKIERIIKIPPSMMLQNWMGSDITNDDVVKQSSIVDDYHAKLLGRKGSIATIELTPKANAAVVWGKIITQIDTTHYTGVKDTFYDENGAKVRTFTYSKVRAFGKYHIPTVWVVKPLDKPDHRTTVVIKDARYDGPMNDQYFSKSALKRFSR